MKYLKKFPLTLLCVVAIFYLCFMTPPHTPLDNVPFMDKWAHVAMYLGTLSVFWTEYWLLPKGMEIKRPLVLWFWGVIAPILMSGIIELLQANCTNGRRSGDVKDFLANIIGVIIAFALGHTVIRWAVGRIKKKTT